MASAAAWQPLSASLAVRISILPAVLCVGFRRGLLRQLGEGLSLQFLQAFVVISAGLVGIPNFLCGCREKLCPERHDSQ